MRRAAKVDDNHKEIVSAYRSVGASVLDLSSVGQGCPDLLVGFRGVNYLVEIKDGSKPPSRRKLTDDQVKFFDTWLGQRIVIKSITEALEAIGAIHA